MNIKLLIAVCGACVLTGVSAESLENKSLSISFGSAEQGFGIKGIVNRLEGEEPFVKGVEQGVDFWALVFHARGGVDGKPRETRIDNRCAAKTRRLVKTSDGDWAFCWDGIPLPDDTQTFDVIARVRLVGKTASSWEIEVVNRSKTWGLFETHYPYFREVVGEGEADVLVPAQGLGACVYPKHASADYLPGEDFNYPGWTPMVMAFMKDGAGLFIAPYDGESRVKRLRFQKNHDLTFPTPVENAGIPGKAAEGPKYKVIVAVYRGDWYEAARIYRKWALRQKWCAKGPLATRKDAPRRMSESHAWLLTGGGPGGISNYVSIVRRRCPDAKFAVECTQWGHLPFDVNYPEMLPGQRGFDDAMTYATSIGVPVMPYMNGRLWDTGLASWSYAKKDATMDESGKPYVEEYGPPTKWRRSFAVMCPAAEGWQNCFGPYVTQLCNVTQCGSIYLDQIACSRPKLCFNPDHGHALGGGTWWADGQRKLLTPVHATLSARNVPITSEGAGEYLLDVIDGYLLACAPLAVDVPFYTAVYGGYASYFGSFLLKGVEFVPYWTVVARATVWGVEPGWFHKWPIDKGNEKYLEALASAARFRETAKDFLAYGHLVGDVRFAEPLPTFETSWLNPMNGKTTVKGTFPVVLGTVWQTHDDRRTGVVLANLTEMERTVRLAEPVSQTVTLAPLEFKLIEAK